MAKVISMIMIKVMMTLTRQLMTTIATIVMLTSDQADDDDDVVGRGQGQLQVLVSRRDNKQEVKTRNLFAIISGAYMHLLMLCTRCLCFLSCVQASPIML